MEVILDGIYYNEATFRLKRSGCSVSVIFGSTMWIYSVVPAYGSSLVISIPVNRSISVMKIMETIDHYDISPIRFPLLLVASAHSHDLVRRYWWSDEIPFLPDEPPLRRVYTIRRDDLRPGYVEDFNTERFFKSLCRSLGKREVATWEVENIKVAVKLLERAGAFEGSDKIKKLAYRAVSKAVLEVLRNEKK